MAKEPLSPKYDEVVGQKAAFNDLPEGPAPDMPYTSTTTAYSDPGHVNPAIEPAPIWEPAERPAPVPVINDPGLLGGNPSLADLNASNRATAVSLAGGDEKDLPSQEDATVSADDHLEQIKQAAVSRLEKLRGVRSTAAQDARTGAAPSANPAPAKPARPKE